MVIDMPDVPVAGDRSAGVLSKVWEPFTAAPYLARDAQRLRGYAAFNSLRSIDFGSLSAPQAALHDFRRDVEHLENSLKRLDEGCAKFAEQRRMERDRPVQSLSHPLSVLNGDTRHGAILRTTAKVGASTLPVFLTQAAMHAVMPFVADELPSKVRDEIAEANGGSFAHLSAKRIKELVASVNGKIGELLTSGKLPREDVDFIKQGLETLDSFSHPPSTFLNETTASPAASYAVENVAAAGGAAVASLMKEHQRTDPMMMQGGSQSRPESLWDRFKSDWQTTFKNMGAATAGALVSGTVAHAIARGVEGKFSASFPLEFGLNLVGMLLGLCADVAAEQLTKTTSDPDGICTQAAKIFGLSVVRFALKTAKMQTALTVNGKDVDSLGGWGPAMARNAAATIGAGNLKGFANLALDKTMAEAAGMVNDLERKLSERQARQQDGGVQDEAVERVLDALRRCQTDFKNAQSFVPSSRLSQAGLQQGINMLLDAHASRHNRDAEAGFSSPESLAEALGAAGLKPLARATPHRGLGASTAPLASIEAFDETSETSL